MRILDEADALLARMTRGEKAQLLQRVVQEIGNAYPGIDMIDDVCGGEPIIVRTRIPVWTLEQARRLGSSEADLLSAYPGLRAEDLGNAWAYVRSHRDQIDQQIRKHEAA
jgi:uncharacterized protein (DUF433 family)